MSELYLVKRETMVGMANAIRTVTGTAEELSPNQIKEAVANIPTLDALDNQGSAATMFEGTEMLDAQGKKVTGTFTIEEELTTLNTLLPQLRETIEELPEAGGVELPTLNNPAGATEILAGYEAINEEGNIVIGTHICKGGSSSPTFSIINNLLHPIIVNGTLCPVGETTSVLQGEAIDTCVIMFSDQDDFNGNVSNYLYDNFDGTFGADFDAYSQDYIYDDGAQVENCYISANIMSPYAIGFNNIYCVLFNIPWDYVNDAPVDGATITFSMIS